MWYFVLALKKYAVFSGRSTRSEYWYFLLFIVILAVLIGAVSALNEPGADGASNVLFGLFLLAVIVPTFAVTVRRLHDIGRSGWWVLINFIPLGGVVIWILAALPSQPGVNRYGPNPFGSSEVDKRH